MAAAQLKLEVTCSICMNIFSDPVTLGCGHSFCKICITRTFDNQHDREYFCPECMQEFRRRPELKKNPRLSNIADHFHSVEPNGDQLEHVCSYCVDPPIPALTLCLFCEAFLCDRHKQEHSKSPEHVLTDPTTSLEDKKCPVHKKILENYCIDDGMCICAHCMTSDHHGHKVSTISEFFQEKAKNLKLILEKLSDKRKETEAMLKSLQDHKMKIDNEAGGIAEKVNGIVKDIRRREDLEKRVLTEISRQQQNISLLVSNDIQQLENEKSEQIEELSRNTNPITPLQTAEVSPCASEEEYTLGRGVDSKMIHKVDDLEEDVALETFPSGLPNIVVGAGTNELQNIPNVAAELQNVLHILANQSTTQQMLPINTDSNVWSCEDLYDPDTDYEDGPYVVDSDSDYDYKDGPYIVDSSEDEYYDQ
ncbi:E3 ubiquitin-protein ligase TRIM8-like [Rana temporaria]|uniref:E3 ubiquitin-protein ligase TRIM8-like n=1 Tax=Rana temporaria TaxID=8407 RepID=UPI001AAD2DEC|nr:E3 ubiquitin-protein ligase TRIM8-like [Rana temporaria]